MVFIVIILTYEHLAIEIIPGTCPVFVGPETKWEIRLSVSQHLI